ncbi:ATP-binding protein [Janthinobacterium tructae]|uniref:ATP-binding protein n=1 Tax=Janthinobacterium tructae TaxID=2590869 RepID=UPI00249CCC0D|nr:ATP-binding protein [Janthinobacterium tructae]MDI3292549.1 ATP-binding protein [Janthinobacterium tructae]
MFEISEKEVVGRLQFDNSWWELDDKNDVQYSSMPRRKYFQPFLKAVTDRSVRRAVVLMGPRRVGKTVMIYHTIQSLLTSGVNGKNILYLSLETPLYTGLALEKILKLYMDLFNIDRKEKLYIFFDEVQYLRDWEIHLKSLVDSFPEFKFVATGSAAAALRLKSTESGAGRFSNFMLPPLTFAEYLQFINLEDDLIQTEISTGPTKSKIYTCNNIEKLNYEFVRYLNFGGYPEAVFSQTVQQDPGQYIKSDIIDKVLLRDLPSLYGITDIQELNRLFTVLAYNTGNEVSLEALSKSAGVAKNTIKRYLEYLEAAFLIKRVDRIDQTAKRFKRAMCFKVYLTNPSMRAALFGQITSDSEAMGHLVETAIFSQWQHSETVELYYARWPTGEIDIVSLNTATQLPAWIVEIKWSNKPTTDHSLLRHCVEFFSRHPKILTPILCTTIDITGKTQYQNIEFKFQPSSLYAYTLGANILNFKHSVAFTDFMNSE